jgi:hypothetical protein
MQSHVMNKCDSLSKLLVTVNARKTQKMRNLFMLVTQRVRPKLFGAKIAAEMFFTLKGVTFHVVFAKSVFPLEGQVLVAAVVVGAEESAALFAHRVVGFRHVVHGLNKFMK